MKSIPLILAQLLFLGVFSVEAQYYNRHYLLGYSTGVSAHVVSTRGKLLYDSTTYQLVPDSFKMGFSSASQATISDSIGNLIISTNGCWIADATSDTMQNGSGINPGTFSYGLNGWCTGSNLSGNPFASSSLLLPTPDNNSQYILFHLAGDANNNNATPSVLRSNLIDMSLNGGLGGVIQKNQVVLQDTINQSVVATKHANGRDWWLVVHKDSTDICNTPGNLDQRFS